MITIPRFETLTIENYALFPGHGDDQVVTVDFTRGLTVIAGINGLGKTTLLTMMLRVMTGAFDLQGTGAPGAYEASLPEEPIRLRGSALSFFSQRVNDRARDAKATLVLSFGNEKVVIRRSLAKLEFIDMLADRYPQIQYAAEEDVERQYQSAMAELFGVATFVDVLLLLHNVVFLGEARSSALWDLNAQRHVLAAMVLDKQLSSRFSATSRSLGQADSTFRNSRASFNKFRKRLDKLETQVGAETDPHLAESRRAKLRALSESKSNLEATEGELNEIDALYRDSRRTLEQARLDEESQHLAVERAKYNSLVQLFPTMDDAAKLLLARILSEAECLVCGADAAGKQQELEALLASGYCPACGADPDAQPHRGTEVQFAEKHLARARVEASRATEELAAARREHDDVQQRRRRTLSKLGELRRLVAGLDEERRELEIGLPDDDEEIVKLRRVVVGLEQNLEHERAMMVEMANHYNELLDGITDKITAVADRISERFQGYVRSLLAESAQLSVSIADVRIGQEAVTHIKFPLFVASMTSAARPNQSPRQSVNDVSESQRELIDLAFRLSLLDVLASTEDGVTFIMETPEASLDALAMRRVGQTLHDFWTRSNHRLVMTNNLTNTGLVSATFGDIEQGNADRSEQRFYRVFNLLEEAAPNAALEQHRDEYRELLRSAVLGKSP